MKGEIYCITNLLTGKKYVGQTIQGTQKRYAEHWRNINKYDLPLYRAFKKYGKENFSVETLEICEQEALNEREMFWISELQTCGAKGYNCNAGGTGGAFGAFDDLSIIADRYSKGERLDLLCKEYHHDYVTIRRELLDKFGIEVQTNAGPSKIAKRIAAIDPVSGKIVKIYNSQSEAGRDLCLEGHNPKAITNHISRYKDTPTVSHGFLWRSI